MSFLQKIEQLKDTGKKDKGEVLAYRGDLKKNITGYLEDALADLTSLTSSRYQVNSNKVKNWEARLRKILKELEQI